MIYVDSSALAKLVVDETESASVRADLRPIPGALGSSALTVVELSAAVGAARRSGVLNETVAPSRSELLQTIERELHVLAVDAPIVSAASAIAASGRLRAGDAIQLASALELRRHLPIDAFACFDIRLRDAAAAEGFELYPPALHR